MEGRIFTSAQFAELQWCIDVMAKQLSPSNPRTNRKRLTTLVEMMQKITKEVESVHIDNSSAPSTSEVTPNLYPTVLNQVFAHLQYEGPYIKAMFEHMPTLAEAQECSYVPGIVLFAAPFAKVSGLFKVQDPEAEIVSITFGCRGRTEILEFVLNEQKYIPLESQFYENHMKSYVGGFMHETQEIIDDVVVRVISIADQSNKMYRNDYTNFIKFSEMWEAIIRDMHAY
jgi:hypothetical protein